MKNKIDCDFPITDLIKLKNNTLNLVPETTYTIEIDYPLDMPYKQSFKASINSDIQVMSLIGKMYKYVYDHEDKFGIWGHDIGDLVLEGVKVNKKPI
jgi:hypothetical protein